MRIFYEKHAEKYLRSLPDKKQIRIENAINAIPDGDIVLLKGSGDVYRLRVGPDRVIFTKGDGETIYILLIGPRGDVYKK